MQRRGGQRVPARLQPDGRRLRRLSLPDPGLQRRQLYLYLRPRRYGLQQRAFLGGFHQCDACMAQPQVRLPERAGYRRCLCRCRGHQGDGPPAYHRHLRPDPRFEFRPDRKPLRIAGDRLQKPSHGSECRHRGAQGVCGQCRRRQAVAEGRRRLPGRLCEMAQAGQLGQAPHGHAHPFRRTRACPDLCRGSRQGRGDDRFGRRGVAQEFRFGTGIQSARRGVERL